MIANNHISPQYFALPTLNNQPLASPELTKYLEGEVPTEYEELYERVKTKNRELL